MISIVLLLSGFSKTELKKNRIFKIEIRHHFHLQIIQLNLNGKGPWWSLKFNRKPSYDQFSSKICFEFDDQNKIKKKTKNMTNKSSSTQATNSRRIIYIQILRSQQWKHKIKTRWTFISKMMALKLSMYSNFTFWPNSFSTQTLKYLRRFFLSNFLFSVCSFCALLISKSKMYTRKLDIRRE